MSQRVKKVKKARPKYSPIKIESGATFALYPEDSPYGTHGPIRYFGDGERLARKEQHWYVVMDVKLYEGDKPHDIHCEIDPKAKCRISALGDTINEAINSEIQDIYKEMEKRNVKPTHPLRYGYGSITCTIRQ